MDVEVIKQSEEGKVVSHVFTYMGKAVHLMCLYGQPVPVEIPIRVSYA